LRGGRRLTIVSDGLPPFQRFLDTHRDAVWRFLVSSVGPVEAEDCFQETFIAALRAYPRLRADSNLRAWVLTIAHRKSLDAHRARARRAVPMEDIAALDGRRGASPPAPDETLWDARAPALGGGAALRGRSPPPRDRGCDRLLGGGGAPFAARGTDQAEKGGERMTRRVQGRTDSVEGKGTGLEDALRRGAAGGAAEAARRLSDRVAAEGLADISYAPVDSPFGTLLLAATRRGLVRLAFPEEDVDSVLERLARRLSPRIVESSAPLEPMRRELEEYFSGSRRSFELPLDWALIGPFGRRVLRVTSDIPYGGVLSYAEVAADAGSPRGSRAAGNALGSNPIPIVIPCHRVLRSGGALGGYGGGLDRKRWLLELEGALSSGAY
jgi:methylated-DNA-[protein]-cysteine S-methyltransferase